MKLLDSNQFWVLLGLSFLGFFSFFSSEVPPNTKKTSSFLPLEQKESVQQRFLRGEKLNINQASFEELVELPGIGPKLARSIVLDRQKKGRFSSLKALERVKGIGPKKLQKVSPYLLVHSVEKLKEPLPMSKKN